MPRKRNSLKHELIISATKDVQNNQTKTSYRRSIKRFAIWAKAHQITRKDDITEDIIQLYQENLKNDPKQYTAATIHTYLAPICKSVGINMDRIRKDKRSSDKIVRGRKKESNQQGKKQETDSRFSRVVEFQRVVGIRRNELRKLKGEDLKIDNAGNCYIIVKRGKGGKRQPQLILPQDVPIVLDIFKNIKPDESVFSESEMKNLINFHKMRAEHARNSYYFYLDKIKQSSNFEIALHNHLIQTWEHAHLSLKEKNPQKYMKQKNDFIHELRNEPYKLRGTNYQKAIQSGNPTIYNRLALMSVSVLNLSHWRLSVTVTNYML